MFDLQQNQEQGLSSNPKASGYGQVADVPGGFLVLNKNTDTLLNLDLPKNHPVSTLEVQMNEMDKFVLRV